MTRNSPVSVQWAACSTTSREACVAVATLVGALAACQSDKGGDTSDASGCSAWTGLQASRAGTGNWFTFGALRPPHEKLVLDAFTSLDIDTNELRVEFELMSSSGYGSNQYDIEYTASGTILGACDAQGLSVHQQAVSWVVHDPFGRHTDIRATATTSWAPPRVLLPGRPEVGERWVNSTEQTTIYSSGETSVMTLNEEMEVVGTQTVDHTIVGSEPALVVQDQNEHRRYIVQNVGLVLGEALVRYSASCCGDD